MQFPGQDPFENNFILPNKDKIKAPDNKNKDILLKEDKASPVQLAKDHLITPAQQERPAKMDVEHAVQFPLQAYEQFKPLYHASMDREGAESFLKDKKDGSFIIRPSSKGENFIALSVKRSNGVKHGLILINRQSTFTLIPENPKDHVKNYASLDDLIKDQGIDKSLGIAPKEFQPSAPEVKAHVVFQQSPVNVSPPKSPPGPLVPLQQLSKEMPQPPPLHRNIIPKIGELFDPDQLESRADIKAPKEFTVGEIAIVARSNGKFQYVMVSDIRNGEISFADDSGSLGSKNCRNFYKPKHLAENKNPVTEEKLTPEELAFEQSQAEGLLAEGDRTVMSKKLVRKLDCCKQNGEIVQAGAKEYVTLSGNSQGFSSIRIASCGSGVREVLLLDPKNSPSLDTHFRALQLQLEALAKCQSVPLAPEQVLKHIMTYVRVSVFPSCRDPNLEKDTSRLVDKARTDGKHNVTVNRDFPSTPIPMMSIDEFINAGTGVCRHHALVSAYLMDRLTKEPKGQPYLEGTVQHIRDNVPGGAHAWTTFIPKAKPNVPPQKWHLDTLWGKVENFATLEGFEALRYEYGGAIDRQQSRTMGASRLNGQPEITVKPQHDIPKHPAPPVKPQPPNPAVLLRPVQVKAAAQVAAVKSPEQEKLENAFVEKLLFDLRNNQAKGVLFSENHGEITYGEEGTLDNPQPVYKLNFSNGLRIQLTINSGAANAIRPQPIQLDANIKIKTLVIEGEAAKNLIGQLKKYLKLL